MSHYQTLQNKTRLDSNELPPFLIRVSYWTTERLFQSLLVIDFNILSTAQGNLRTIKLGPMQMHISKLFSYMLFFKTIHKINPYINMKQDLHTHKSLAHSIKSKLNTQAETPQADYKQFKPQKSQTASPTLHTHTEHGTATVEGSMSRSLNVHPNGTDLGHGL